MHDVARRRKQIQRCGIRMIVAVRILAPIEQRAALRPLVRDLTVGALMVAQKFQGAAGAGEIAIIRDAPGIHERVAAEEPGEAGPLARARRSEARHQTAADAVIALPTFVEGELGPFEGLIERGIRRFDVNGCVLERPVVAIGFRQHLRRARQCVLVELDRLRRARARSGNHDRDRPAASHLRRDVHFEQHGVLRQLVANLLTRPRKKRRANYRRIAVQALFDDQSFFGGIEGTALAAERSRPHGAHLNRKRRAQTQRARGVDIQQNSGRRQPERWDPRLANGEGSVGVRDGYVARRDFHPLGQIGQRHGLERSIEIH